MFFIGHFSFTNVVVVDDDDEENITWISLKLFTRDINKTKVGVSKKMVVDRRGWKG